MTKKKTSIDQFVKDQLKKWESAYSKDKAKTEARLPVITVSMEPGSGGSVMAQKIAANYYRPGQSKIYQYIS